MLPPKAPLEPPGAASGEQAAHALLEVVSRLLRDSRPSGAALPPIDLDRSLDRDLGIDSLAQAELLLRLEQAFDVQLPDRLLRDARTPRDLLRAVLAGAARSAESLASIALAPSDADAPAYPLEALTLAEVLDWHAARHPDRLHVLVLPDDGEGDGEPLTYGALREEGRCVARGLAARGVGAGDAIALMLPTSRDFFRAFTGILLAGAVPVPIYPPARRDGIAEHLRRQARILQDCEARALVTIGAGKGPARVLQSLVPSLRSVVTVQELARDAPGAARLPRLAGGDTALVQYTSGSTGDPKGVVLTHANLLANIRAMGQAIGAGANDVFVSWLPLYHDMGLIGAWMGSLHFAFPLVVMPPLAFINRPSRWLRAMHRFRGTLSSAPNFAYELCATRVDPRDVEGLDLSAWRLAFNGAEPVSAATLERFARRYSPLGFRREAFMPVYGLAECAVGLSFPPPGRGPRLDRVRRAVLEELGEARPAGDAPDSLAFVSCGMPLPGHQVRVVGADGRELAERLEGRIQFRGPSATAGYLRSPGKTAELVRGEWHDTGDLGYLADGELYVTSRVKDIVIRGGQHVHPYEVEQAIGRLPGVRKGCVAVFGVPDEAGATERLVVLAETRLPPGGEQEALRLRVGEAALAVLGAPADDVALAPPHTVLKTSSGKVRRAASRELYLRGLPGRGRLSAWATLARFVASLATARLRRGVRDAAQLAYAARLWTLASVLGSAAFAVTFVPGRQRRWRWLRALARGFVKAARIPVAVQGLEHLPATGAAVLVANHASYLDGPLLFALLPRRVRFVAKRELAARPLVRRVLEAAGVGFVERFDAERGADDARELSALARSGEALLFFAEGTFTRAPGLRPFHMGAFFAATQADAPVLPVALRGTRSMLRDGQWRPRRGPVAVRIGAPRRASSSDWRSAAQLRDQVRAEVLATCGEPDLS